MLYECVWTWIWRAVIAPLIPSLDSSSFILAAVLLASGSSVLKRVNNSIKPNLRLKLNCLLPYNGELFSNNYQNFMLHTKKTSQLYTTGYCFVYIINWNLKQWTILILPKFIKIRVRESMLKINLAKL